MDAIQVPHVSSRDTNTCCFQAAVMARTWNRELQLETQTRHSDSLTQDDSFLHAKQMPISLIFSLILAHINEHAMNISIHIYMYRKLLFCF